MGEPVLVDLNEESDGEEGDYESWQPDPIDADPSTARHTNTVYLVHCPSTRQCGTPD